MKTLPYVGCYWADRTIDLAATCGNFVIVGPTMLLHQGGAAQILRHPHLQIVLQIPCDLDSLTGRMDGWRTRLHHIIAGCAEAGVLERVVAVIVDEELYSRAEGGAFAALGAPGPGPQLGALVCDAIERHAALVRAEWPRTVEVLHVETWWAPERHRPVPSSLTVIGVDAYIHGAPVSRPEFDRQVVPVYRHAATLGRPILAVPQAFADESRHMPTVAQLRWWVDLAADYPQIAALAWFCLDHPARYEAGHGTGTGLTQHPAQLAAVRWYADFCGIVPQPTWVGL